MTDTTFKTPTINAEGEMEMMLTDEAMSQRWLTERPTPCFYCGGKRHWNSHSVVCNNCGDARRINILPNLVL